MSRYNYNSRTWAFTCTKCKAQGAEGDFIAAYEAYKVTEVMDGLWCKACRDKLKKGKKSC